MAFIIKRGLRLIKKSEYPSYRFVILGLLALSTFIVGMNQFVSGTLIPTISEDIGLTPTRSGIIGAISQLAMGLLLIPISNFFYWPKYKAKIMILVSGIGVGLSLIGQSFAYSYETLVFFRLIGSIIGLISQAFWVAIRMTWFPQKEFGKVGSIFMGFNNIGQFFALGSIPLLMNIFSGWRTIIVLFGGITLGYSILWLFLGKEVYISKKEQESKIIKSKKKQMKKKNKNSPFMGALKHKEIVLLMMGFSGIGLIWQALLVFYPTFLLETYNIPLSVGGPICSMIPLGGLFASLISGSLSDKIGLRKPFIWPCGIILPICYYLLLQPFNTTILFILSFIAGFFGMFFVAVSIIVPMEIKGISPAESGAGSSAMVSTMTIVGVFGPFLAGYIYETMGSFINILSLLSLMPATLLITYFMKETGWKKAEND